jgi:acyl-[acyl-carrier-protein]-phospholipid O-acyltransferase/long-chain-fatty-acid--[acyl-carrier-protein] ligase
MNQSEGRWGRNSLRGFWCLLVTQFQGAFSDNALKNLVVFMVLGLDVSLAQKERIGELVGALFALPFILFSMFGGFLADHFSKRAVTIGVKQFEIVVMCFATLGLMLRNTTLELTAVFLMGVHSALFGPSKYGLLPELLPEKKLSWGNGLLELGTFMAIILGTVAAALMAKYFHGRQIWSGMILMVLAFAGLAASRGITRVPAANPAKIFKADSVAEFLDCLVLIRKDPRLTMAVAGNTYFSFLGALLLLDLFFYGTNVLHADETGIGMLNVALALGIGLGSVAAGYLSGGKIEYGLVPFGAVGMAVASMLLAAPISSSAALVLLALLGFSGGFFIVPVSALLQDRPHRMIKGEVLAAANLLSFVGVLLASVAHYVLTKYAGLSPQGIFIFGGVLTLCGVVVALVILPDALLRAVLWALTRTVYRIRIEGRDEIPEYGGALLICNHVSFMDALLLMASTDRRLRFMMHQDYHDLWWIKPFAKSLGVIPIASNQGPRAMVKSLQEAGDAVRIGYIVCIFAEGQITRTGELNEFHRGYELIMKDVKAPIVPVALVGVWGSIFSFEGGKFFWKWPRHAPYPVTLRFGKPLPPTSTPDEVRAAVQQLLTANRAV